MSEFEALLPYGVAALIALVVAFCRSTIANVPPTVRLRIFDAIVCAAGAVSVCVVAGNHFSLLGITFLIQSQPNKAIVFLPAK
jgi:hypothetical protein